MGSSFLVSPISYSFWVDGMDGDRSFSEGQRGAGYQSALCILEVCTDGKLFDVFFFLFSTCVRCGSLPYLFTMHDVANTKGALAHMRHSQATRPTSYIIDY